MLEFPALGSAEVEAAPRWVEAPQGPAVEGVGHQDSCGLRLRCRLNCPEQQMHQEVQQGQWCTMAGHCAATPPRDRGQSSGEAVVRRHQEQRDQEQRVWAPGAQALCQGLRRWPRVSLEVLQGLRNLQVLQGLPKMSRERLQSLPQVIPALPL